MTTLAKINSHTTDALIQILFTNVKLKAQITLVDASTRQQSTRQHSHVIVLKEFIQLVFGKVGFQARIIGSKIITLTFFKNITKLKIKKTKESDFRTVSVN